MLGTNGGYDILVQGKFSLSSGTCKLLPMIGGNGQITLAGTYVPGDTITYTLNGHGVTYTVVLGSTSLSAIATGLAAAINADGTDGPLVTATAANIFTPFAVPGSVVNIVAKTAAWQLAATIPHAAAASSSGGTATLLGTNLIALLLSYTSGSAVTTSFNASLSYVSATPQAELLYASLVVGTAIISSLASNGPYVDSTLNQTLALYAQLSVGSDGLSNVILQATRL